MLDRFDPRNPPQRGVGLIGRLLCVTLRLSDWPIPVTLFSISHELLCNYLGPRGSSRPVSTDVLCAAEHVSCQFHYSSVARGTTGAPLNDCLVSAPVPRIHPLLEAGAAPCPESRLRRSAATVKAQWSQWSTPWTIDFSPHASASALGSSGQATHGGPRLAALTRGKRLMQRGRSSNRVHPGLYRCNSLPRSGPGVATRMVLDSFFHQFSPSILV